VLPANWQGKKPGAEKHAMHGLMLSAQFSDVKYQTNADAVSVSKVKTESFSLKTLLAQTK